MVAAADGANVSGIDGARVLTDDGWWLLRASNTQDVLVARCESATAAGLDRLKGALAAQIAAEVRAAPGEAEAVLEKHEMTVAEYEALLFEVASDPALSKEYLAALN